MAALLPLPTLQLCDADGKPYAGGSLTTLVPGTTTGKLTWVEPSGTVANSNPIILDAAGRFIAFGDGDYRLVLNDAAGNLIFDLPSSTIVSAAMQPVISAPTIADAVEQLGINDLIAAEASARVAADSAEAAARTAADSAEAATRAEIDNELYNGLEQEIARATAAEAAILGGLKIQHGYGGTDGAGHARITFTTAYTDTAPTIYVTQTRSGADVVSVTITSDDTGFDTWFAYPSASAGVVPATGRGFCWLAIGT